MIPACKLWEKTSAKGNRYFVGRLGGVKVLIMENTRSEREGDGTHTLFFTEATPYVSQAAATEPSSAAASANGKPHRKEKRPQLDDDVPPLPEDEIPF